MFIQEMSESDCFKALTRARFGRLACARDNQPYIVPIYFVYEGPYLYGYLYGFTTLGQKVEWMRSNPLVCVELDEVENSNQWTSVIILGRYEELPEGPGMPDWDQDQRCAHEPAQPIVPPRSASSTPGQQAQLHALELLQQHAEWWEPGLASSTHHNPKEPLTPIFYRIHVDRITGRRAKSTSGSPIRSGTPFNVRGRSGWLRRVFEAISKPFSSRKGTEAPG